MSVMTILSKLLQRSGLAAKLGKQFNGRRDLYDSLGYVVDPKFDDYFARYDRQDIAGRIVDAPVAATWRNLPIIKEDDDEENWTDFEEAWHNLTDNFLVHHYLSRVDKLAGIGHYAVLLIGVSGGGELSTPLQKGSLNGPEDIIYLSPYSEKRAEIHKWVTDPNDKRFGKPESYMIDFSSDIPEAGLAVRKQIVHHSRVIHVADGLLEDEVFGRPRLKRALNLLDDLAKVAGGSAEMFWRGAFKGVHANLEPDTELTEDEAKQISEEIEEYYHGLRRFIRTQGMQMNALPGEVADPSGVFEVLMSLLSGATNIPKRVLLGAERGELASSQDETNWNAHVKERQIQYAEPMILRPFIDRLIWLGALPEPEEPYKVEWPNLFEMDVQQKADIALKKAQAIQAYAPFGETDRVVPVSEFREKILELEPEHEELEQKQQDDDFEKDVERGDSFIQRFLKSKRKEGDGEEEVDDPPGNSGRRNP